MKFGEKPAARQISALLAVLCLAVRATRERPLIGGDELALRVSSSAAVKSRFRHAFFYGRIGFHVQRFPVETERHRKAWFLKNKLGGNRAFDRAAIRILRHRKACRETTSDRKNVALPTAPHQGIALTHHETVAGVREGCRIIAALGAEVNAQGLIAAIHDVVENCLIAALHVDRFEDQDVYGIFDPTCGY